MGICDSLGINSIAIRLISCCFVIATRGDLREEFSMADEAFALSPISARAALPSEEDYAAISEAFMETSRGRWFLTEYAKRNRNADTRMVLDAVARIEQSLAAQKEESLQKEANLHREENLLQESLAAHQQQAEEAAAAATAARNNLNDALAAMRGAVEAAQQSAAEALDSLALEQRLAPVRKGARVLREIAWRLREIGNDGRICDLIDSQVAVIETGAEQISSDEARAALRAAFAALEGRLSEFGDEGRTPAAETEAAAPLARSAGNAPGRGCRDGRRNSLRAAGPRSDSPVRWLHPRRPCLRRQRKPLRWLNSPARPPNPKTPGQDANQRRDAETQDAEAQNAEAHDEALLDMIAMEMGAPDPISDEEIAEAVAEQARLQTHLAACGARAGRAKDCARTGRRAGAADSAGGSTVSAPRHRTSACTSAASHLHLRPRWECRSARPSSRAACCESRPFRPTIRWRRSGA